jgi:lycopene cyclase domain-containing protein
MAKHVGRFFQIPLPGFRPYVVFGPEANRKVLVTEREKLVFWAIIVPGTYLSLMDIVALQATTWSISTTQTTGILFFKILPLEEATFFFVTNMMITFGITLLLSEESHQRFEEARNRLLPRQC